VVICLPGFLSEGWNDIDYWRPVANHYRDAEIYTVTWNALSPSKIFVDGAVKNLDTSKKISGALAFFTTSKKQFLFC